MSRGWASVLLALALVTLAAANRAHAEMPSVVVRTQLDPKDGVVIGQPVRLLVDVLFPDAMPRPPRVGVGDAPGAQIVRFETQGVTIRDRIGDRDYVGQRFEFVVFPRRGGVLDVPGAEVTLLDTSGDAVDVARGGAEHLAVSVPPGLDASQPVIATDDLTVTQQWTPEPTQARFKAGGALVRTIRRRAAGMPAMGMADLPFTAPDGVRVYVEPPQSDDRTNRGEVVGSRIDKVTYVFEKPGRYDLPDLRQSWWNLASHEARTETLPGAHVEVAAEPASTEGRTPQDRLTVSTPLLLALLAVGAFAALLLISRKSIEASMRRSFDAKRASAAWACDQLCRIAPSGDASTTYKALTVWLSRLPETVRQASTHDERLERSRAGLNRVLFGRGGAWSRVDGATLKSAVTAFRRDGPAPATSAHDRGLPPLNPPPESAAMSPPVRRMTGRSTRQ